MCLRTILRIPPHCGVVSSPGATLKVLTSIAVLIIFNLRVGLILSRQLLIFADYADARTSIDVQAFASSPASPKSLHHLR